MTIAEYLQTSTDYYLGLHLLEQQNPKHHMLPKLRQRETTYNKQKLRQILRTLPGSVQVETLAPTKERPQDLSIKAKPTNRPTKSLVDEAKREPERTTEDKPSLYPAQVSEWMRERAAIVRQREMTSNNLALLPDTRSRAEARARIDHLQQQVRALTDKIKTWERTGEVIEDVEPMSDEEYTDLVKTIRSKQAVLCNQKKARDAVAKDEEMDRYEKALKIQQYKRRIKETSDLIEELKKQKNAQKKIRKSTTDKGQ